MLDNNSSPNSYKISIVKETEAKFLEITRLHKEAIESGHDIYTDPETGCAVLTAKFLLKRGYCCGSGCRHCPYSD